MEATKQSTLEATKLPQPSASDSNQAEIQSDMMEATKRPTTLDDIWAQVMTDIPKSFQERMLSAMLLEFMSAMHSEFMSISKDKNGKLESRTSNITTKKSTMEATEQSTSEATKLPQPSAPDSNQAEIQSDMMEATKRSATLDNIWAQVGSDIPKSFQERMLSAMLTEFMSAMHSEFMSISKDENVKFESRMSNNITKKPVMEATKQSTSEATKLPQPSVPDSIQAKIQSDMMEATKRPAIPDDIRAQVRSDILKSFQEWTLSTMFSEFMSASKNDDADYLEQVIETHQSS